MKCTVCGAEATGRFCSACGATLAPTVCPSCQAQVKTGARFCHLCGRSLGSGTRRAGVPWIVAGATLAALAVVLLIRLTPRPSGDGLGAGEPPSVGGAMGAATTDISSMSPRERADRLYNRVMAAAERGDTGEIRFFAPMALSSYDLLGGLDPDARYHVGMIHLVNQEYTAAAAQADSITRTSPKHLLAVILRAEIAGRKNDTAARTRAYRDLLANYDAEMATGRPEYADHRAMLDGLRDEARKAVPR
ncbi:MAG: zinc ribbon domain-containing protein [Gemmatimonadetes bacterium]|nr:zinc ribbon domain-containing protein [Gemmatimonadota bacterium]